MPFTVTDAWLAEAQSANFKPVWLVEISGYYYYLSWATRPWASGSIIQLDEGLLLDSGLSLDDIHQPAQSNALMAPERGGIGAIAELIDPDTNQIRVSNTTLQLADLDLMTAMLLRNITNAVCRIWLASPTLGRADRLPVFYGFLDRQEQSYERQGDGPEAIYTKRHSLDVLSGSFAWHKDLNVYIGQNDVFPGAQGNYKGQAIPIVVGNAVDLECLQVRGDAAGSLAFQVESADTVCYLVEYGAPFPEAGEITLGTETSVTYSSREIVATGDNQSYLKLSGLSRGSPVTQTAGSAVTLTSVNYDFLIGYQIAELLFVREDGVVLSSGYTLITDTSIGQAVSILRFSSQPGIITADVLGGNVRQLDLITNGTFETGSTSPWTAVDSGTLTIATATPDPYKGTYYLDVEGAGAGTDGGGYNDFPTEIGKSYTITWAYQDDTTSLSGSLLSFIHFDTLPITDWTETIVDAIATLIDTPSYASYYGGFGYGPIPFGQGVLLPVPSSYIDFGKANNTVTSWSYVLVQDASTSIGINYVVQMLYAVTPSGTQYDIYGTAKLVFKIGTTGNPDSLYSETISTGRRWTRIFIPFTATDTTTRVTVEMSGTVAAGWNGTGTVSLSSIYLIAATTHSYSTSRVAIGTTTDVTKYYNEKLLPIPGQWTRQVVSFVAEELTTRFTFYSQYSVASLALSSYLDEVTIFDEGRNPVDVIRYLIENFLPQLPIDDAAFLTAHAARATWLCGGTFRPPGHSKILLDAIAEQADMWRYEDEAGQCVLVPRERLAAEVHTFSQVPTTPDQAFLRDYLAIRKEHHDHLYTEFYIYYGLRTGTSTTDIANYGGVVYCRPGASSSGDITLESYCEIAQAQSQSDRRLTVLAYSIQDAATAELLLSRLVFRHTDLHYDITWRSNLGATRLKRGDVLKLTHAQLPFDSNEAYVALLGKRHDPATAEVEFVGRTLRRTADPLYILTFEVVEPPDPGVPFWLLDWESGTVVAPGPELYILDFEWPSPITPGTSEWTIDFESGDPS